MNLSKMTLAGLVLFAYEIGGLNTFAGPPSSARVEVRRIATVSPSADVLLSNDLAHFAVIDHHGRRQRLTVDGKAWLESEAFRFVNHAGPTFSRAGIPILYARGDRGRWRLVVNGVSGPECDAWIDQVSSRAADSAIAYTAVEISRKAFVADDGRPGPIYDDVSLPVLSPDRAHIAYVVCVGQGTNRRCLPFIDGRAEPECEEIAIPSSGTWCLFSADNKHTAYAARFGRKWRTIIDAHPGPEYDEIAPDSMALSSDGGRFAYAARAGSQWCVVHDGRTGQSYDGIGLGPIRFLSHAKEVAYTALSGSNWLGIVGDRTPVAGDDIDDLVVTSRGRVAFVCRRGQKWQAIIDHQPGPEYDRIGLPGRARFWISRDGTRLAYAGRLGSKWHVVVDGRREAAYDEIQQDSLPFYFSPDGTRTAYAARIGEKWSMVIDGQPGPSCDEIRRGSFEFSEDGKRTAYAARQGEKWCVFIDNKPGPEYEDVDASSRIFTLRGTRVAYAAVRHRQKWCMVINGKEGPQYDDVSEPIYSPDGRRMAYVAGRIVDQSTRDQSLVLDGQPGPWYRRIGELGFFCGSSAHVSTARYRGAPETIDGKLAWGHDNVYGVVFSLDGRHIAYPAGERDAVAIIHDGKPGPTYYRTGTPVFSSDGQRLAYTASVGDEDRSKQLVVVDGQSGPSYDEVELPRGPGASCFSPDGKRVVYAARKAGQWHAVLDGREGPACDALFGPGATTAYGQPAAFASWRSITWQGADDEKKPWQYSPQYDQCGLHPLYFGAGGEHVAYVGIVRTKARVAVVVNSVPGPRYEQVGKPVVSDDGRRMGYVACRGQGDHRKFVAVIDGREGPAYDEIPLNRGGYWEPFSHGGQHSAYKARVGRKWLAVVDGQPGPEYDEVYPVGPGAWYGFFSDDGSRVVYLARRGKKWRAVIDGREGPEFDCFQNYLPVAFSPDGKHVAYIAQWRHGSRWRYRAIIDGREGPEYEAEWGAGPVFSPDSRRTAYVGQREGRQFVVLDGKELTPHDAVDGSRLLFSPDSQRLAYIAYRGKHRDRKAYFVLDGQGGREYEGVRWSADFSPDSKHAAYIAINGRWQDHSHTEQLVVDGKEGPVVGEVDRASLRWSSDGRHLAYIAHGSATSPLDGGRTWVVLDGKAQTQYVSVDDLAFSADGKHLAYKACRDWHASHVVLDGQPGPAFDEIEGLPYWAHGSPFTPDGRHLCYQAKKGGKCVVVLDNQPGPAYDSVLFTRLPSYGSAYEQRSMWPPHILPDGAIQYAAMAAGNPAELYVVTQWPAVEPGAPRAD